MVDSPVANPVSGRTQLVLPDREMELELACRVHKGDVLVDVGGRFGWRECNTRVALRWTGHTRLGAFLSGLDPQDATGRMVSRVYGEVLGDSFAECTVGMNGVDLDAGRLELALPHGGSLVATIAQGAHPWDRFGQSVGSSLVVAGLLRGAVALLHSGAPMHLSFDLTATREGAEVFSEGGLLVPVV